MSFSLFMDQRVVFFFPLVKDLKALLTFHNRNAYLPSILWGTLFEFIMFIFIVFIVRSTLSLWSSINATKKNSNDSSCKTYHNISSLESVILVLEFMKVALITINWLLKKWLDCTWTMTIFTHNFLNFDFFSSNK